MKSDQVASVELRMEICWPCFLLKTHRLPLLFVHWAYTIGSIVLLFIHFGFLVSGFLFVRFNFVASKCLHMYDNSDDNDWRQCIGNAIELVRTGGEVLRTHGKLKGAIQITIAKMCKIAYCYFTAMCRLSGIIVRDSRVKIVWAIELKIGG